MAFYRWKMHYGLYEFVVVEGDDIDEAYDHAQNLPQLFGDATLQSDDTDPEPFDSPLGEEGPVFTRAYFDREFSV